MSQTKEIPLMEKIVSLCKRKGFIFQSSEIYGGINGFWDYGPLGAELKRNLRDTWWRAMTREREDVVGIDATIIMHPNIWKASGHVDTFSDPMSDCLVTGKRFRSDHVEQQTGTVYSWSGADDDSLNHFANSDEFRAWIPGWSDLVAKCDDLRGNNHLAELVIEHLINSGDSTKRDEGMNFLNSRTAWTKTMGPFSVLLPPGKPPEAARKVAIQFYQKRGLAHPKLRDEKTEKIENTRGFNPENGAPLTPPRPFNLMFKTHAGPVGVPEFPWFDKEEGADLDELGKWGESYETWLDEAVYLRPETAQAIFAQFKNVSDSTRVKVPFGICQIGKAFRNEVTPRNFTFRSREFEQMELEFFIPPDEAVRLIHGSVAAWSEGADLSSPQPNWGWEMWHRYWVAQRTAYYAGIGLGPDVLDYFWQGKADLAHYARACVDILFKFPFGTEELEGIAARGDFDLTQHQKHSGKPLEVFDEELRAAAVRLTDEQRAAFIAEVQEDWNDHNKSREDAALFCERLLKGFYVPHVIEPSAGLDRLALAVLTLAYTEVEKTDAKGNKETLTVMRFHPRIAPKKVAVFPLLKNKPELVAKARAIYDTLKKHVATDYDEGGSIGKRYARQDEAGTPFCVTVDFDTLGEKGTELLDTVTLRHRDDGSQERVKISDLLGRLLPLVS